MRYLKSTFLFTSIILFTIGISAQETRIEPNTCIKIESGTTFDISIGNLVLESNNTGDASLIDLGDLTYSGGGQAKVQRYLTEGKWHLIASPVSNATAGIFSNDYLQNYTESTYLYTDITSASTSLNTMQGYALWSVDAAPSTEEFLGITNKGDLNISFTQTDFTDNAKEGWNLVGNPYPSALDWDAVSIPAEINGAIWLFDPTVGDNGDYKYYISGGGAANTTSQYISSGQGFFIRATAGAGILAFDNSVRIHNGQDFYKSSHGNSNQMLILKATGNNITTQTAIRFNTEASPQIDRLYDVYKINSSSPSVPVVYSKCENQNMAINTFPTVVNHETIPIYFEAGLDGNYYFTASEIQSIDANTPIYLEDIAANYFQNLRSNPEYEFNYIADDVKNFKIHFKDITGIETLEQKYISCYLVNDILTVNFIDKDFFHSNNEANISVYSITGQTILNSNTSQINNRIPFNANLSVYLVKIISHKGISTFKLLNR